MDASEHDSWCEFVRGDNKKFADPQQAFYEALRELEVVDRPHVDLLERLREDASFDDDALVRYLEMRAFDPQHGDDKTQHLEEQDQGNEPKSPLLEGDASRLEGVTGLWRQ
jgi:hypothetical protein